MLILIPKGKITTIANYQKRLAQVRQNKTETERDITPRKRVHAKHRVHTMQKLVGLNRN